VDRVGFLLMGDWWDQVLANTVKISNSLRSYRWVIRPVAWVGCIAVLSLAYWLTGLSVNWHWITVIIGVLFERRLCSAIGNAYDWLSRSYR
jgi:hypothetical protein